MVVIVVVLVVLVVLAVAVAVAVDARDKKSRRAEEFPPPRRGTISTETVSFLLARRYRRC